MKKTLVKLGTVFMSVAMLFTMTGCSQQSEFDKALEGYTQYNHVVKSSSDIEGNYYVVENYYKVETDEETGYDTVRAGYDSFSGYYIDVEGTNELSFDEKHEDTADENGVKSEYNYLDEYELVEKEKEDGRSLESILIGFDADEDEYEIKEESDKKTITFTFDEKDTIPYSSEELILEEAKITVNKTSKESGTTKTEVYEFNNVDENYYSDAIKTLKSLNGASRAEVKEKLGQFIEEN